MPTKPKPTHVRLSKELRERGRKNCRRPWGVLVALASPCAQRTRYLVLTARLVISRQPGLRWLPAIAPDPLGEPSGRIGWSRRMATAHERRFRAIARARSPGYGPTRARQCSPSLRRPEPGGDSTTSAKGSSLRADRWRQSPHTRSATVGALAIPQPRRGSFF
jgi:hypothetical protein